MSALGLRGRFFVAGVLLVATSAASSAWSAWAFRRVARVVDATVQDSEQTTAATGALATALEREDDGLLLTLTDEARGRRELHDRRIEVQGAFQRADALLTSPSEREAAEALRRDVDDYHQAGDALMANVHDQAARIRYHEQVNPLLRRAVGDTAKIRDEHFRQTQEVAAWARDQSTRATQILASVFAGAILLSLLVALYLARVVVLPIRELTAAVDAVRRGDFAKRVTARRPDELGQLADGFNRMSDDLAEFRRTNIGEVIRAKETLEATLAALPDAVLIIEPQGDVSSANARANDIVLATRGTPARTVRELPLPDTVLRAIEASLKGDSADLPLDLAKAISVPSTTPRKLLPRIVRIEGRGVVLVLSDVTELVRLDEMRTELVAVASHELRTPLTTLRMTLLMLQEQAARLDQRDRDLVATALIGVEQLSATVIEFLDLTRIEAGQLRLYCDRVDVGALLDRAVQGIRPSCNDKGVSVRLVRRPGAEAVWGDAPRLTVVLSNVLTNAAKYTPSGGRIEVLAYPQDGGARVRIDVTDSGPGVPSELRERVFEKFFRVEHHRQDREAGERGAGIGLYLARQIVVAHGGAIRCEPSASGLGACFAVVLPSMRAEATRDLPSSMDDAADGPGLRDGHSAMNHASSRPR